MMEVDTANSNRCLQKGIMTRYMWSLSFKLTGEGYYILLSNITDIYSYLCQELIYNKLK
jgi:hypothetical protein